MNDAEFNITNPIYLNAAEATGLDIGDTKNLDKWVEVSMNLMEYGVDDDADEEVT